MVQIWSMLYEYYRSVYIFMAGLDEMNNNIACMLSGAHML